MANTFNTSAQEAAPFPPDLDIMENLGTLLLTIDKPSMSRIGDALHPENIRCVGSYNWTDERTPTIVVPGSPAQWRDKTIPFTVPPDPQTPYNNPNSDGPELAPLIVAVQAVTPGFDWSSVDLVTDRNNLRKIMRWIIDGTSLRTKPKTRSIDFRINLELAGANTLLMERWDTSNSNRDFLTTSSYKTYGLTYKDATTTPIAGCQTAPDHLRVICYDFGDLRLVVRFQVDACLSAHASTASTIGTDSPDLESAFTGLTLSTQPTANSTASIVVRPGASLVPQTHLVEIATRKGRKGLPPWPVDWHEIYIQLYTSHTPHHFLARHENGRFFTVQKRKLGESPELEKAGQELQPAFRALKEFLSEVREIVADRGSGVRSSLVYREGMMRFYTCDEKGLLPDGMMELFSTKTK